MASETHINETIVWQPNPGPQTWLLECPVFEVLFGGARGGGKSDAVLGEWASHADMYGKDAIGLCVRRERTQLVELVERSKVLFHPLGAKFDGQDKMWRFPNGARLRFAYLESDSDAMAYQGHSYCVEQNTKIRMANGTLKAIKHVKKGEYVATLEGPRKVLATVKPYKAPCVVSNIIDHQGISLGQEVFPVWHPVMTIAAVNPRHISSKHCIYQLSDGMTSRLRSGDSIFRSGIDPNDFGWSSFVKDGGISYEECFHVFQEKKRLGTLSVPVVLHEQYDRLNVEQLSVVGDNLSTLYYYLYKYFEPTILKYPGCENHMLGRKQLLELFVSALDFFFLSHSNAPACARTGLKKVVDYLLNYFVDNDLCDPLVLFDLKTDQYALPSLIDAEDMFRGLPSDVWGTIPIHTRFPLQLWVHPYTGEARHLVESVTNGTMVYESLTEAYVADLCVEHANHYITESGLVQKNTRMYVEEMGTFPNPAPIFMLMATLRSGAGVPCRFIATANPGGPGHSWIKARYIDQAPAGMRLLTGEFLNPFTKEKIVKERIFIPSKITDNKYTNNADYIGNLYMAGGPELVKAWLLGDWNVMLGAFFPEWSTTKHVIKTFKIPKHWTRFMSLDWGTASPFSVGWWAVVPDEYSVGLEVTPDQWRLWQNPQEVITLPKGAIIRYREWYGSLGAQVIDSGQGDLTSAAQNLNKGLKLTAEEVAEGIALREADEPKNQYGRSRIDWRAADPAIFANTSGPSIAERMGANPYYINLQPADNKRVGALGHIGGWDMVRQRLKGDGITPMMYFMENCTHAIRTLPILQHNLNRPEDADTEGEDHAPDEIRYACMSRPYSNPHQTDIIKRVMRMKNNNLVLHDDLDDLRGAKYNPRIT